MHFIKKYCLCLFMFFTLCANIQAQNFDINTLKQTNLYRNKNLDVFFTTYSNIAPYASAAVPLSIYAVGIYTKNKNMQQKGLYLFTSAAINAGITFATKYSVNRPRPYVTYPFLTPLENLTKHSFPSGHTSSAFNTATSLTIAYPKWYIAAPAFTFAAITSYSRMHIGVHYPTDVAGGILCGVGSAWLSYKVNKYLQHSSKTKKIYNKLIF